MNYSLNALEDLEHDIDYWCSRYWIPGYEKEDLKQECRMSIWKAYDGKYNHLRGTQLRTWSNMVIKNRLKELLRNSYYDCRSISHKLVHEIDTCIAPDEDIEAVLSILIENHLTLDDIL